ncbi:MAG: M24 family metallopeptidase [Firmicutes bacterium]|nr:M24 family metallopeptidase [Bacillota bacterium]
MYSCAQTVERMTGLSQKGTMETPTQDHDRRHVLPYVLSHGGRNYFLVRQIEAGNLSAVDFSTMPAVFFNPYFLPGRSQEAFRTVTDAVRAIVGDEKVTCDAEMPASIYTQLRAELVVDVDRAPEMPVRTMRTTRTDVLRRFNHHRNEVAAVARRLTSGHPDENRLAEWYEERPDKRFELLDSMASERGVDALLGTWVADFQELSGFPGTLASERGFAVLYLTGSDEVWLIIPSSVAFAEGSDSRDYPGLSAALRDIVPTGTVGYEADTIGASALLDMEDRGIRLAPAGDLMQDWREEKAFLDIPYFVVAAMASRYAVDGAADFATKAIRAGVEVTERDVDRVYLGLLSDFAKRERLPVTLEFYFTGNHTGARTIFPARPGNHLLSRRSNSLKIDAGVFVVDDGLFHACSDIARTVTTTEAAAHVADAMEEVMLLETIPSIRPGMTGAEIHHMGVGQMASRNSTFSQTGYMPPGFDWATDYPRDIGHVIERQESNTFGFKPGISRPVHHGMVACVEFHCAYEDHAITCEDTFVVDDQGSIVISRGPCEFGPEGEVSRRHSFRA